MKSLKEHRSFWIAGLLLVVLIFGVFYFLHNRKTSVIPDKQAVSFAGYSDEGTAAVNPQIDQNIKTLLIKKSKVSDEVKKRLVGNEITMSDLDDIVKANGFGILKINDQDAEALKKINNWYKETKVDLTPIKNLKNGQKVKLEITTNDDRSNPIKAENKTYVVKGLKKLSVKTTKQLISKLKVKFYGYNGHGIVVITDPDLPKSNGDSFTVEKNGSISNGDRVKIQINESTLKNGANRFIGKSTFSVKASGLIDLTKVENIAEIKQTVNAEVQKEYKPDQYQIKQIALYAVPMLNDGSNNYYYGNVNGDQVYLNDKKHVRKDNAIELLGLYKVTPAPGNEYIRIIWNDFELKNNQIVKLTNSGFANEAMIAGSGPIKAEKSRVAKVGQSIQ